ncbi:MAG: thioredoxin family protein, partial [Armatimonadetes bacterium]|nr:thioredoxin family protein [Armatimonadota bacterium]
MAPLTLESQLIPFSLMGTDGRTHTSDEYRQAKVFGMIFTCNHCPYARAWEHRLIEAQRAYAGSGVQFVLINSNDPAKYPDDGFEQMQRRAKEKAYPFPYLFDETQEIARAYGATRTPEIFLFDADRVLRYHGAPDDNYEDPTAVTRHHLREAVGALLAGRRPEITETRPVGCTIKWK